MITHRGVMIDFSVHNLDTPVSNHTPAKNNHVVSEFIELEKYNVEGKFTNYYNSHV